MRTLPSPWQSINSAIEALSSSRPAPLGVFLACASVGTVALVACSSSDVSKSTTTGTQNSAATQQSTSQSLTRAATSVAPQVASPATSAPNVPKLDIHIVDKYDFPGAPFVQGTEFEPDGSLLVGTGLYGQSQLYRLPAWQANPGKVQPTNVQDLEPAYFGEGITRSDAGIWQLTWREHTAVLSDAKTLQTVREVPFDTEGWGACKMGNNVYTSDGTGTITLRSQADLSPKKHLNITIGGQPTVWLNELECDETSNIIWANVWQTDTIYRIDAANGQVTGTVDARALREALPAESRGSIDVLNGIAKIPGTDTFLLTGKKWPQAFEVTFSEN